MTREVEKKKELVNFAPQNRREPEWQEQGTEKKITVQDLQIMKSKELGGGWWWWWCNFVCVQRLTSFWVPTFKKLELNHV